MRLLLTIPLLIALPSCAVAAPAQTPCQVAVEYLKLTLPRMHTPKIVFGDKPSDPTSVLSCRSVRDLLSQRAIGYGPEAAARAVDVPNHGPFKAAILSVSMPRISNGGRKAEMNTGTQFAPLGGEGRNVTMTRRSDGSWAISEKKPTWIS
jgi:hypothetical protein